MGPSPGNVWLSFTPFISWSPHVGGAAKPPLRWGECRTCRPTATLPSNGLRVPVEAL